MVQLWSHEINTFYDLLRFTRLEGNFGHIFGHANNNPTLNIFRLPLLETLLSGPIPDRCESDFPGETVKVKTDWFLFAVSFHLAFSSQSQTVSVSFSSARPSSLSFLCSLLGFSVAVFSSICFPINLASFPPRRSTHRRAEICSRKRRIFRSSAAVEPPVWDALPRACLLSVDCDAK